MTGDATRRLGQRLAVHPDGNPGRGVAGQAVLRQAVVATAGATTVGVLLAGDDPADPAQVGWISAAPPAVGDVGWVAHLGTHMIWLGTQNRSGRPPARWLGEEHATTSANPTASVTVLSLTVDVPTGLPAIAQVRVEGRLGHAISAAGVGVILDIDNTTGGQPTITTGSVSGGLTVIRYAAPTPTGSRTFNLTLGPTVPGQQVTGRYPSLEAWIV